MKKRKLFISLALVTLVLILAAIIGLFLLPRNKPLLLKECPEEWVENRMPFIEEDNSERQYFIISGERKEVKGYDIDWIKTNCSVKIQYTY